MDKIIGFLASLKGIIGILHEVGSPIKIVLLSIIILIILLLLVGGWLLEVISNAKEKHESLVRAEQKYPRFFAFLYGGKVRFVLLVCVLILLAVDWRDSTTISPPHVTIKAPPPPAIVFVTPATSQEGHQVRKPGVAPNPATLLTPPGAPLTPPAPQASPSVYAAVEQFHKEIHAINEAWRSGLNKAQSDEQQQVQFAAGKIRNSNAMNGQKLTEQQIQDQISKFEETQKGDFARIIERLDTRESDHYAELATKASDVRERAIARMSEPGPRKMTPNQANQDKAEFDKAWQAGSLAPSTYSIEQLKPDIARFQSIDDYFANLQKKLGDYP